MGIGKYLCEYYSSSHLPISAHRYRPASMLLRGSAKSLTLRLFTQTIHHAD